MIKPALRVSDLNLKALHASWQAVLQAEMKSGRARTLLKIDEGNAELARHDHNELVSRLLIEAGGRPLAFVINMETGELEKVAPPSRPQGEPDGR